MTESAQRQRRDAKEREIIDRACTVLRRMAADLHIEHVPGGDTQTLLRHRALVSLADRLATNVDCGGGPLMLLSGLDLGLLEDLVAAGSHSDADWKAVSELLQLLERVGWG